MSYFEQLELSNNEKFAPDSMIYFNDGLNYICEEGNAGGNRVFHALQEQTSILVKEEHEGFDETLLTQLIFFDESVGLQLWELIKNKYLHVFDWLRLEMDVTDAVRELLQLKFTRNERFKQFSSAVQIQVTLDEGRQLQIFYKDTGYDLGVKFQAHTERMILHLAFNKAIRQQLPGALQLPFVSYAFITHMGEVIHRTMFPFVLDIAQQVILIEHCDLEKKAIFVKPGYRLVWDQFLSKTRIISHASPSLYIF